MLNSIKRLINGIVPVLFVAAGIALVVMGFKDLRYQKEYVPATAVVSRIEEVVEPDKSTHPGIYVKYTVDGKQFESILSGMQPGCSVGDEIPVRYDPKAPEEVVFAGTSGSTTMFIAGGIAIVLGLAGAIILFMRK